RSPASRIRSASSTSAKAASARSRFSGLQWMSPAAAMRIGLAIARIQAERLGQRRSGTPRVPFMMGPRRRGAMVGSRQGRRERSLRVLATAGLRTEEPAEGWLYKAFDGDLLIDLIFEPSGQPIEGAVFERAEELNVNAVPMEVMALEDVFVTKLTALREHELDYESVVQMARPVREQVDWNEVRTRTVESPYAQAFFTLVEELGIVDGPA